MCQIYMDVITQPHHRLYAGLADLFYIRLNRPQGYSEPNLEGGYALYFALFEPEQRFISTAN